jgi:hypothetical protein
LEAQTLNRPGGACASFTPPALNTHTQRAAAGKILPPKKKPGHLARLKK